MFLDKSNTDSYIYLIKNLNEENGNSILKNMCRADIDLDLRSLNLTYCDRMTMAASVEARVPFLDLKFANFCYNLPDDLKIRSSNTKYILKKSMEGYLPNEIIYREKAGFALPIRSWITHLLPKMMKYFDPKFLRSQGVFNPETLTNELYSFQRGNDANCFFFVLLYSANPNKQIWFELRKVEKVNSICVIGLGYIGLPTSVLISQYFNPVIGVDTNPNVLDVLLKGECHIDESA